MQYNEAKLEKVEMNPTKLGVLDFTDLVKSVAYRMAGSFTANNIYDKDALEQEFYVKILDMLPNIHRQDTRGAAFALVKTSLQNRGKDLLRYSRRRPDMHRPPSRRIAVFDEFDGYLPENMSGKDSFDVDGMIVNEILSINMQIGIGNKIPTASQFCMAQELDDAITAWAAQQDEKTQEFVDAAMNPSEKLENWWLALQKKSPNYRQWAQIPPLTLAKHLKISHKKYYKIRNELRDYLMDIDVITQVGDDWIFAV